MLESIIDTFAMVGNKLFTRGVDIILKICVSQVKVPDILEACHDSACGGHFLVNLHANKYLEHTTFGLPCFRTHTIMLESMMFAKGMLGMILEWRCHYMSHYH